MDAFDTKCREASVRMPLDGPLLSLCHYRICLAFHNRLSARRYRRNEKRRAYVLITMCCRSFKDINAHRSILPQPDSFQQHHACTLRTILEQSNRHEENDNTHVVHDLNTRDTFLKRSFMCHSTVIILSC